MSQTQKNSAPDFHVQRGRTSVRWLLLITTAFLVSAILSYFAFFVYEEFHEVRFYKGVKIGQIDVSGLTVKQAEEYLDGWSSFFESDGLPFYYKNVHTYVRPEVVGADLDLTFDVFAFNFDKTLQEAYAHGREVDLISRFLIQYQSAFKKTKII